MRLGLMLGYSGAKLDLPVALVQEAEALGYDSVWTAEAWGSDAVTPLGYLAAVTERIKLGTAIMQVPGRSPANTAMTAMTLDALSKGRFLLGLGTSGPQVVEGWHGLPFTRPLTWLREYITIVRAIHERKEPLTFHGKKYRIPYDGPDATGQGKPLRSILHGRPDIPIYTGSMSPKSQAMSAEIADGCLLTCMHPGRPEVIEANLAKGLARVPGKRREDFDLAPTVAVVLNDDVDAARLPMKHQLALYIGGMGSKKKNFYKDYLCRVGFEEACERIQALFLAGKRHEAVAAVPDELVDTLYLVGPPGRIRERFSAWKDSGVGTLVVGSPDPRAVRLLAELA